MNRNLVGSICTYGLLILSLSRCAGPFLSRKPLAPIDSLQLVHEVQKHADQVKTMQGSGSLTLFSKAANFRGTFEFSMKQPDSLWMKIEGPLGIDLAKIRLSGDSITIYSPFENILYLGSFQSMKENPVLPIPVEMDQLLHGITGLLIPQSSQANYGQLATIDNNTYCIQAPHDWMRIQPKGPVIDTWIREDSSGSALWEWQGENFKKSNGVRIPRKVKVTVHQPEQRMILVYNHIKINQKLKQGWANLKVPESAVPIHL